MMRHVILRRRYSDTYPAELFIGSGDEDETIIQPLDERQLMNLAFTALSLYKERTEYNAKKR